MAVGAVDPPELTAERRRRGKHQRARAPRRSHGSWTPASDRPDPVSILGRQNRTRVPELIPLRFERMLFSPFTFLRGLAGIMAWGLAHCARTDLTVMANGDAHLANFGLFAAGPAAGLRPQRLRRVAPRCRMGRQAARDVGTGGRDRELSSARITAAAYRETIQHAAQMPAIDVW